MSVTLLQGLILALIVFAFAWDARWECFFVFHPIIVCFVTGLVLGDWKLGLEAGAIAELSYLGLTTVGGTVPPNALIAGLMTVVLAYKSGVSAETALGLSLPFALLMRWIVIACQSLFSGFNVKVEQAIKQNDIKKFKFYVFLPEIILTSLYAVVAFLSTYALQNVLSKFVNSFPEFVSHGFEIAGGLLPGLGLALLLKVMVKKENVPYLIIGFLIMSIMKPDNVLPVALFAIALVLIDFMRDKEAKTTSVVTGGEDDGKALDEYGVDFINTEQHAASFLMGLVLSMEENRADRKLIKNMKTGLFGSFAGIGDAIFWFTLLPISGSIAASLCKQHSILGPIFFLAFWILMAVSRVFFLKAGYKLGSGAISKLTENAKALTKGAGILGVMVVGAMIPSYVTFEFPEKLKLFGTVGVQSIFDSVIPNLLPALFVGILYYIFKKKKVSIVVLILAIIAFAILMSLLGWL